MKKEMILKLILAAAGILLAGVGLAFNAAAALGNDPVGMLYDGLRSTLQLSPQQLGTASNLVNVAFAACVFFLGRSYLNIGTLIYILPYGLVVNFGTQLYHTLFSAPTLPVRVFSVLVGCLLLYTGVALFITADIGLDPLTGFVMSVRDRIHWEFRTVKILFDVSCVVIGFLLGGQLGLITLLTAFLAGPSIQQLSSVFQKWMRSGKTQHHRQLSRA